MSSLLLWRHAATPYNKDRRLQGSLDIPLDDAGRAQASRAARALVERYGGELRVHSSPLARALGTAQALTDLAGGEVNVDSRLTQRSYGVWEGMTWEEIRAQYPAEYARRMRYEDPDIEGWDNAESVAARVSASLREIADGDRTVVMVSHGSAISLGLLALVGLTGTARVFARLRHAHWVDMRAAADGTWQVHGFNLGADWS
jgi:probable phosphoglycerate mutase